jgi:hypothetical protein
MATRHANSHRIHNGHELVRSIVVLGSAVALFGATASAAGAHEGEAGIPSRELVQVAIAILEVHPVPEAAVEDKIADAQESEDQSGVKIALVKEAGEALERRDVAATKRLLEQSIGECPDADVLYVSDQPVRPPCVVSVHELAVSRRSVGGTSEVVLLVIAAVLSLAGVTVIRHPFVRKGRGGAA